MSENLQTLVLHWIIQTGTMEVLQHIKKTHFDHPNHIKIYEALSKHAKLYNKIPSVRTIIEYGDAEDQDWYNSCVEFLEPLDSPEFIGSKLNTFIKTNHFRDLMHKAVPQIQDGKDVYTSLLSDFESIAMIDVANSKLTGDLIEDTEIDVDQVTGMPTFLPSLNEMTAAGGFYSPQTIVFMGGPKTFKTGFLINVAVNYAYDGYNVFYGDFENGQADMKRRLQQCVCQCTADELYTSKNREYYKKQKEIIKTAGGHLYVKSFIPRVDTTHRIDTEIAAVAKNKGWVPQIIILDYVDIIGAENKQMTERRHIIQNNYMNMVALNKKYDACTFTVSKIKQGSFNKARLTVEDFAEDSEKAYNAHAAFAFLRDDTDFQYNRARIAPVAQRSGISRGNDNCWIEIDETRQMVWELEPSIR